MYKQCTTKSSFESLGEDKLKIAIEKSNSKNKQMQTLYGSLKSWQFTDSFAQKPLDYLRKSEPTTLDAI